MIHFSMAISGASMVPGLKEASCADETHNRQNRLLQEGLDALDMQCARTPRNISDPNDQCGYTTFGSGTGTKQASRGDVPPPFPPFCVPFPATCTSAVHSLTYRSPLEGGLKL